MDEIEIRKYQEKDRPAIRDIAWNSAFLGQPASAFFDDKEMLASFLTEAFTEYEPHSCFVAVGLDGKVVGYIMGTKDASRLGRVLQKRIVPAALLRSFVSGRLLQKKQLVFSWQCIKSFLRREFYMPAVGALYPATLHINLDEAWRNSHIGSRLMSAFLDYLAEERIGGVYLATLSEASGAFFEKQGFTLLYRGKRSYFRYLLHSDTPLFIYAKIVP